MEDTIMPQEKEVHDPLKGFYGKPIVSEEIPGENRYLGRIIVELYEAPDISSDANGLAFTTDPAHQAGISAADLLERIAAALPVRIAKDKRENR